MPAAPLPPIRRAAVALAWIGLGLSLLVHVVSLFGVGLIDEFVFLHFGVMLLAIGALLWRKDLRSFDWKSPLASQRAVAEAMFAGAPPWAKRAVQLGFLYALAHMLALVLLGDGGGELVARGGRFVVENHGRVVRELSEDEYRRQLSLVSRMFSAFWAVLYSLFVILYSAPSNPPEVARGRSDRAA